MSSPIPNRLRSPRLPALLARVALAYALALSLIVGGLASGAHAQARVLAGELAVLCLTHPELAPPDAANAVAGDRHLDCLDHCSAGAAPVPVLPVTAPVLLAPAAVYGPVRHQNAGVAPDLRHRALPPPSRGPPAPV